MKLPRYLLPLLCALFGITGLQAQNQFSLQIPDTLSFKLLNDFQMELGEVLYKEIEKNNLALYHDVSCTRQMNPEEVTHVFQVPLDVDILDPETLELRTVPDTLYLRGQDWDSVRWNRKSICIYTEKDRMAYLKTSACIEAAANDPWVKKTLHMLLLHQDEFFLSEDHNKIKGQAMVDSLQGKLQNALMLGELAAYLDPYVDQQIPAGQLDSIFKQTVTILIEENGELLDQEVFVTNGPEEQVGFLLFGTSHGNTTSLQIDFRRIGILAAYWEIEDLYPMYFSDAAEMNRVLDKKDQLLLELLIQHALNPLDY